MTRLAPPSVHVCPGCSAFFLRPRFRSVNFFGAHDWSDGVPTMWWRQEPLVRCEACAALFWFEDIEQVGVMPDEAIPLGRFRRAWLRWWGDPEGEIQAEEVRNHIMQTWGQAHYIGRVDFDDLVYVLSRSKGVSRPRLLWLRKRIWWELNNRYRKRYDGSLIPNVPTWPVDAERSNMEFILDMLRDGKQDAGSLLLQGELLRLLGRFDEAISTLKAVPADGYHEVRAVKIERLARCGDMLVQKLSVPTR